MSSCSTVLVSFVVGRNRDQLVALARRRLSEVSERSTEAGQFLSAIASGGHVGVGRKGDVVSWGCVGNYVSAHDFVGGLLPFFVECYSCGLIADRDHVMVLFQREQESAMDAYEIRIKDYPKPERALTAEDLTVEGAAILFPSWDADDPDALERWSEPERLPPLDLSEDA